jgi:hypothetical protein
MECLVRLFSLISVALVLAPVAILAQRPPRIQAAKLSAAPVIDGKIGADEWKQATKVTAFVDPVTGKAAQDQTEAYVGYTGEAIFVAFYAHDSHPEGIVGREITPGAEFNGEDTVTFRINPYGARTYDGRSQFSVNVLNTQQDFIAGGRAAKREWRGVWKSAVARQPDGYSVEMKIPWKVLNYPPGKGLNMDLDFVRFQARGQVTSRWASTSVSDRPELSGFWVGVDPPPVSLQRKTEFLGYVAPEAERGDATVRSGLDVRHHFTPLLTGLLSIEPDFRNIESQIAGIDFSHTEKYLDESRPFFNEGSGYFDLTDDYTIGHLFYSRRIETFDYGVKAFGNISPTFSMGALATVDTGNETAAVFRAANNFGPKASASVFSTYDGRPGSTNGLWGMTAFVRHGSFTADTQLSASRQSEQASNSAGAFSVGYDVPRYFALLRYEWVQPDFQAPLAYIPWTDRRGAYLYLDHFMEWRHGPLRNLDVNTYASSFFTYEGEEQQRGVDTFASLTTRRDVAITVGKTMTNYSNALDNLWSIQTTLNASNRFRQYSAGWETGTRGGTPSNFYNVGATYRLFKNLDVGFQQSILAYNGSDSQTIVSIGSELSPARAITGRMVAQNGDLNAYLAFRNGGLGGTELFIILGDPNAATTVARVSVKVVFAF